MEQIITSLLDNDLYKFSMGQLFLHQFSDADVEWNYKNRDAATRKFTPEMTEEIKNQIKLYCNLKFSRQELDYLRKITWLHKDYIDFLSIYQPQYEHFVIKLKDDGQLELKIVGPQFLTTYYETQVMAIISEVWFKFTLDEQEYKETENILYQRLEEKIKNLTNGDYQLGNFSEFGTRRRFSKSTFNTVIQRLAQERNKFKYSTLIGTSNVEAAMKFNLKPTGTMAHEAIQLIGQGYPQRNPAYSNKFVMDAWHKEYGTENGTYLTDCIGTDAFLKDFNKSEAILFDGVRHDSGDPYQWAEKMINHYNKLGVDPKSKTLLFSDSLNFEKATNLYKTFSDRIKVGFGIGTFITNDTNIAAMNQVLKITRANGLPVAKLSDASGKNMCNDNEYIEYLKRTIKWRLDHENNCY